MGFFLSQKSGARIIPALGLHSTVFVQYYLSNTYGIYGIWQYLFITCKEASEMGLLYELRTAVQCLLL